MTLMFYFVVKNNGGTGDIRVETGQFVHFFLNAILKSGRSVEMTSRELNIHINNLHRKGSYCIGGTFAPRLEYIHLFLYKNKIFLKKIQKKYSKLE